VAFAVFRAPLQLIQSSTRAKTFSTATYSYGTWHPAFPSKPIIDRVCDADGILMVRDEILRIDAQYQQARRSAF
jgi:hypothetical protein